MNQVRMDAALLVLAISLATLAVRRARATAIGGFAPVPVVARVAPLSPRESTDSLDAVADAIVDHDPFRLSNSAADVAFDPHGDPYGVRVIPQPIAAPPRPTLVLRGISGGPPWQAIIDGLPGQGTTLVTAGATFDKLVVRAVTRDSVVVRGSDTTWVLRLTREQP